MGVLSRVLGSASDTVRSGARSATRQVGEGIGAGVDDIAPGFDGVQDSSTAKVVGGVAADQPSRAATAAALSAENVLTTGQRTALGLGAIGGGAFAANEYYDNRKEQAKARAKEDQSAALQAILNDPDLTEEQKQAMIEELRNAGFFDRSGGDEGIGFGLFSELFADRSIPELAAIFLIIYFVGRAATESLSNAGGSA